MPHTQQLVALHQTTLLRKSYLVSKHIHSVRSHSHLLHTAVARLRRPSQDRIRLRSMSTHMTSTYRGPALSRLLCRPRITGSAD